MSVAFARYLGSGSRPSAASGKTSLSRTACRPTRKIVENSLLYDAPVVKMVYKPIATAMVALVMTKAYAIQRLRAEYTYTLWYVWTLTLVLGRFAVSVRFGLERRLVECGIMFSTVRWRTHWEIVELMRLTVRFWNMTSNSLASAGRSSLASGITRPAMSARPAANKPA